MIIEYSKERLIDILRFNYRKQDIPDPVIKGLAEYTRSKHGSKSSNELDSIAYLGGFDDIEPVNYKIDDAKGTRYIYDHFVIEHEGKYHLFEFWFRPYD